MDFYNSRISRIKIEDKKTLDYIQKIQDHNGKCYVVGGFVRDVFLGRESKDIDIEVYNIEFDELVKLFGRDAIIYSNFGVFNVLETNTEFSLPRKENKIGHKHADFKINIDPKMSLTDASLRRDFTMNSLMYDFEKKTLVDNWNGVEDINNKIIRHISIKFIEDPLRILRAIRFSFTLGFEIAEETFSLCMQIISELKYISKERKSVEFRKSFLVPEENFKIGIQYFKVFFEEYYYEKLSKKTVKLVIKLNENKANYTEDEYYMLMWAVILLSKKKDTIDSVLTEAFLKKHDIRTIKNIIKVFSSKSKDKSKEKMFNNINLLKEDFELYIKLVEFIDGDVKDLKEIYQRYFELIQKYNGNYFLEKGFSGKDIKDAQKEKILKEL